MTVAARTDPTEPVWWVHWLAILLAVAGFTASVIHPGYTLPPVVAASAGTASVVLAMVSTAVITFHAHGLKIAAIKAIGVGVDPLVGQLVVDVGGLKNTVPSQAARITAIEGALQLFGVGPQTPPEAPGSPNMPHPAPEPVPAPLAAVIVAPLAGVPTIGATVAGAAIAT